MAPVAGAPMPTHVDPNQHGPTAPPQAPPPGVATPAMPVPFAQAHATCARHAARSARNALHAARDGPRRAPSHGADGSTGRRRHATAVHVGSPGTTPLSHRGREKLHQPVRRRQAGRNDQRLCLSSMRQVRRASKGDFRWKT